MKKLILVVLSVWLSALNVVADSGHAVVTGRIAGNDSMRTLTFSYQEYAVLSELRSLDVEVGAGGDFRIDIDIDGPTRAFLSLGSIPVSETFTVTRGDGSDTTMTTGTNHAQLVYFYLTPGDHQDIDVTYGAIPSTLLIRGDHARNSLYLNHEDWQFNQYRDKHLKNYFGYVNYSPDQYITYVEERQAERTSFLENFHQAHRLSKHLLQVARNTIYGDAIQAKLLYPRMRNTYRDDNYQPDPGYYSFLKDVRIDQSRGDKGIAYFYFIDYLLREKYRLDAVDDDYYDYVGTQLSGRLLQEYYAFALRTDFRRSLYDRFASDRGRYRTLNRQVRERYAHLEGMLEGSPAPALTFQHIDGSAWSWEQARGKLIYIDFWATWCGPCIEEIPALETLQADYKDKPIVFLSMSLDSEKHHQKWKDFVRERELGGVQVWADEQTQDSISKAFNILQIPRFVLLDRDGKMLDANAPRPSDPRIREFLDRYL